MTIYVTYLTTYFGSKLPMFYIGSTSLDKIESGYRGSVSSKSYCKIWQKELNENFHLFKIKIISKHKTRKEALEKEQQLQINLGVVKSPLYVNKSVASPNGFFGMDVSGKNNPNYGKIWSPNQRDNLRSKKKGVKLPKSTTQKMSESRKGNKNPMYGLRGELCPHFGKVFAHRGIPKPKFSCITCKKVMGANNFIQHVRTHLRK